MTAAASTQPPRTGRRQAPLPPGEVAPVVLPRLFDRTHLIRASRAVLSLPVWLQALAVYFVSRLVALGIMAMVVRTQPDVRNWRCALSFSVMKLMRCTTSIP